MILPQGRKKTHKDVSFLLLLFLYHRRLFAPAKEGGRRRRVTRAIAALTGLRLSSALPPRETDLEKGRRHLSSSSTHSPLSSPLSDQPSSCRPPPSSHSNKDMVPPSTSLHAFVSSRVGTRGRVVSCPRSPPFPKRRGGHKMDDGFR